MKFDKCDTCLRICGIENPQCRSCHDGSNWIQGPEQDDSDESRIDVIGANGNDGLHYPDPIVEAVRAKLLARSQAGMLKYGVTLARKDLSRLDWLNHLQQELLDAANYVQVLIEAES